MWQVTQLLPLRFQAAGFELTEDEDFLALWHEHEWVGRFLGMATNMPYIISEASGHLLQHQLAQTAEAMKV